MVFGYEWRVSMFVYKLFYGVRGDLFGESEHKNNWGEMTNLILFLSTLI